MKKKKNKKAGGTARAKLALQPLALPSAEERFQTLIRLSSDFYWETDAQHRLRELLHGPGDRLALPREQMLGKTRWELPSVFPDAAGWHAHVATLEARLPVRGFEFARQQADGEVRHYTVSGEPVFDAAGEFRGYRGIGREITERKRVEQTLTRLTHYESLRSEER